MPKKTQLTVQTSADDIEMTDPLAMSPPRSSRRPNRTPRSAGFPQLMTESDRLTEIAKSTHLDHIDSNMPSKHPWHIKVIKGHRCGGDMYIVTSDRSWVQIITHAVIPKTWLNESYIPADSLEFTSTWRGSELNQHGNPRISSVLEDGPNVVMTAEEARSLGVLSCAAARGGHLESEPVSEVILRIPWDCDVAFPEKFRVAAACEALTETMGASMYTDPERTRDFLVEELRIEPAYSDAKRTCIFTIRGNQIDSSDRNRFIALVPDVTEALNERIRGWNDRFELFDKPSQTDLLMPKTTGAGSRASSKKGHSRAPSLSQFKQEVYLKQWRVTWTPSGPGWDVQHWGNSSVVRHHYGHAKGPRSASFCLGHKEALPPGQYCGTEGYHSLERSEFMGNDSVVPLTAVVDLKGESRII